jgi:autotransporter passenger strand-loop-strand repeat protein
MGMIIGSYTTHNVESNTTLSDAVVSGYGAVLKVLEGGSALRTEVKTSGYLEVQGGGKANSANINGYNAEMSILAHGIAQNTAVKNGGTLYISVGGSALNVNIDETGTMLGNFNSDTYITGTSHGKAVKFGDNVASNITVYEYRYMDVDSKWTAYDTIVSGYNARQDVLEGGSAVRTEVKTSGYLEIQSGGKANSANINANRAEMYILAHGIASNTTVKNGGVLHVSAGGSAINVDIDKTGTMSGNYNSETYVTGTSHGKAVKFGDNVASNITVYEYR